MSRKTPGAIADPDEAEPPGVLAEQLPVQTDVLVDQAARQAEAAVARRVAVQADRRFLVGGQEAGQTATVVEMVVGDDRQIDIPEVDAQLLRVIRESIAGAGVEQDPPPVKLQVKRQPMLGAEIDPVRRDTVLDQDRYLHRRSPSLA